MRKKDTGNIFAMKVMHKEGIVRRGRISVQQAIAEKVILQRLAHPFIVKMHFAFQDDVCPMGFEP